jgi:hypothetical protein
MRMTSKKTRVLALTAALALALCAPAYADNFGVSGSVAAGQSTGATLVSGDLGASRSTTTGVLSLGGSSSSCTFDYGVTVAGKLNSSCAFTSLTANNSVIAVGAISAGYTTAPGLTAGDIGGSRSTSTGALVLGGSSSSCTANYGITTAGQVTFACPLKSTSAIVAGENTAPTSPAAGDLVGSRSATTGALELGGTSSAATIDYGVNHASSLTLSSALFGTTGTFSGAVTSPVLPPVFFGGSSGSQLIASPHIELFEGQTVGASSTVTFTFKQAFTNSGLVPTCSVTTHSASTTAANISGVPTTTQVLVFNGNGSSVSADVICISE